MGLEELVGAAPSGWEYATLGEICARGGGDVQTGPFGSQLHAYDYVPEGIPSIMPQNIGDNRVIEDGIARITSEDAERLSRYRVRLGDIVYSRRGDVEKRALIREGEEGWLCGTGCLRLRLGNGGVNPVYASYYLAHPNVREWIVRHAHGATMPNLNTAILSALPFLVPPKHEQRAIAHILGTLDDKIELNRRMNETLESMARAHFKAWFVDFEPVRAKAEGRDPGLPNHLSDLFPDLLENSELGEIPGGWNIRPIGEVVRCVGGSTPSTEEPKYWESGTNPFVTPKDMSSLISPVILGTERLITDAGVGTISSGRLPVGTVLLSSRAPIGYLAITEVPASVNQGIIAMICEGELSNHYVVRWLETNMEIIKANAGGTTFAEISKKNFRPIPVIVPPQKPLSTFVQQVEPLHQRIVMNVKETNVLASLRDMLLPKLISGDLRVKDAERFLAGVVA